MYTVEVNGDKRDFTLLTKITNRVRVVASSIQEVIKEEEPFNNLMKVILIGDHEGINWFDHDAEFTDKVITDFFGQFTPKMEEST
jgi:hypothetical protein